MSKEQLTVLSQIYNTMLLVETKGENTMIMAECIKALQMVIGQAAKEMGIAAEPEKVEEKGE